MKTHTDGVLRLPASVIAIGVFDGVHQGHQAVIQQAVDRSRELQVPSVVYTFDPPPRAFFQGARILTPLPVKLERLAALQVDHAIVAPFDESYARCGAGPFIERLAKLNPLEVRVGEDFRFGRNREGDINLLNQHFQVKITHPVCCAEGQRISSTRIRQLIAQGEIERSFSLLGWSEQHFGYDERGLER
ncbi:FAD synthetase family protein [Ammoniphilus sp. YIM 78166]|uniref:FAD synthetase family protein n=1 Tax=Ammoniphilus sp. YIM 78166 TaxID=1644106 RepID=UPI00106F2888|nr:FAD synthetase family protein [Ammoniphilus sp. YIM 78166]